MALFYPRVFAQSLSKDTEDYDNASAHVELAKKMKKRDPATAPQVGDRVPYVIIKAAKVGHRHLACSTVQPSCTKYPPVDKIVVFSFHHWIGCVLVGPSLTCVDHQGSEGTGAKAVQLQHCAAILLSAVILTILPCLHCTI